jgi:hypothetical protein
VEINGLKLQCIGFAIVALAACGRSEHGEVMTKEGVPRETEARPVIPAPGTGPDARTPFAPAKPAIDPKSTAAAEELARGFARLLNERKFDEAYRLMGPDTVPRKDFDHQLTGIKDLQATVGTPGQQEGAAGSIYIGIPLTITGEANGSQHVSWQAGLILRRVNDVPGSTGAQRRWHIERLNLSGND